MNERLKERIIETLRDYLNALYSLRDICCIYDEENSLADAGAEVATLIGDVREIEVEKTEINSSLVDYPARVTCEGLSYTTYVDFFRENLIEQQYTARYDYGIAADEEDSYRVVGEGYHNLTDKKIYVLQNIDTSRVYLVEEGGVKFL